MDAETIKARFWRALIACFRGDLKLREDPPTVGVIVRSIIVVSGQHEAPRGERGAIHGLGGDGMHGLT